MLIPNNSRKLAGFPPQPLHAMLVVYTGNYDLEIFILTFDSLGSVLYQCQFSSFSCIRLTLCEIDPIFCSGDEDEDEGLSVCDVDVV